MWKEREEERRETDIVKQADHWRGESEGSNRRGGRIEERKCMWHTVCDHPISVC